MKESSLSEAKRILLEQRLKRSRGKVGSQPDRLSGRPSGAPILASPGQQQIWTLRQLDPTVPSYNITSSYYLEGPLDSVLLKQAIQSVFKRHEILRTTYHFEDKKLYQRLHTNFQIKIDQVSSDNATSIEKQMEILVQQPFDLEKGPLARVLLGQIKPDKAMLVFVVDHIAFDEWSLGIFWKEVSEYYCLSLAGESPKLTELSNQYADYAFWQHAQTNGDTFQKQLAYWKKQLSNLPESLKLPTDRPYPSQFTQAGCLERLTLSSKLATTLKIVAMQASVSSSTVLLCGFKLLLHLYSESEDLLVGIPVTNRKQKEVADLIGFFLNTVCVRTDLSGNPTINECLNRTQKAVADAISNQDVPLQKVIDAIAPERIEGRLPLIQVMFVYERESEATPQLKLSNISAEPTFVETHASKFDLTLFVVESESGLKATVEYRTDLFDASTMHRMLCHYEAILAQLVENPEQRLSELNYLTNDERENVLSYGRGDQVSFEHLPLVPEQVVQQARLNPKTIAIQGSGKTVTYEELQARIDRFASHLFEQGIKPGDYVGLLIQRSPDAIVALLAIMKMGAVYLPVDPEYPEDRIRFMLEDADVSWLVTATDLLHLAETFLSKGRCITEAQVKESDAGKEFDHVINPDDTAYIIYTSGSTGKPKGVLISHDNLRNSTAARSQYYPLKPGRFLLIPNLSFDSSVAGIFWTLTSGGTLIIPEQTHLRDPDAMRELIANTQVNTLLCVPSLYQQWLAYGFEQLKSLRAVIVAGERSPPTLVQQHFDTLPDCQLFNEYGPTEGTVWSTVAQCTPTDAAKQEVPIGKPIANCTAYVLDSHQRLLPIGFPGELYLGGKGIAQEYLNRPELSKERFIATEQWGRLYRTGDRAKWDAAGQLHFLGRDDEQVKIRGYRIELGEVEAALLNHPDIEEAVVVATKHVPISLEALVEKVPAATLDALIDEIQLKSHEKPPERSIQRERFRLDLHTFTNDFIQPPRKAQRDWLLSQAMAEFSDDLEYLDLISREFVSGYDHQIEKDLPDISRAKLTKDQIMEDWQVPIMQSMAEYAAESKGDVLEIGFGRGVSAEFIQQAGVRSHTVVEFNDHSVNDYFKPWRRRHEDKAIKLIHARWQDAEDQLGQYDSIFFHAFPLNENEFVEYILKSVTFAEHAFPTMAAHLNSGGVFTYLTTEINSLSRRHQRLLFQHFSSITLKVVPLSIPEDTHDTWWAPKMVVIKAVK